MSIREADVAALRGCALLSSDTAPGLDHVTLAGRSMLLASLMAGHDLRPGDVVALLAEQSTGAHELLVGVRRAGLVLMVIDLGQSLEQMAFAINTSGAQVVVASTGQAGAAQALVSLTPYIRARYGLDGDFAEHRSLALARSAAPVRVVDAEPCGTLHHVIGASRRPVAVRLPDPVVDPEGRRNAQGLLGDLACGPGTVLVGSAPAMSAISAQLATVVLVNGGSVAVPRRPTGVEVMRSAFAVDATLVHLTSAAAAEIADLGAERVLRLTPPELACVVLDGAGCAEPVRVALVELWGSRVRVVEPAYLALDESDCSVTQAEI